MTNVLHVAVIHSVPEWVGIVFGFASVALTAGLFWVGYGSLQVQAGVRSLQENQEKIMRTQLFGEQYNRSHARWDQALKLHAIIGDLWAKVETVRQHVIHRHRGILKHLKDNADFWVLANQAELRDLMARVLGPADDVHAGVLLATFQELRVILRNGVDFRKLEFAIGLWAESYNVIENLMAKELEKLNKELKTREERLEQSTSELERLKKRAEKPQWWSIDRDISIKPRNKWLSFVGLVMASCGWVVGVWYIPVHAVQAWDLVWALVPIIGVPSAIIWWNQTIYEAAALLTGAASDVSDFSSGMANPLQSPNPKFFLSEREALNQAMTPVQTTLYVLIPTYLAAFVSLAASTLPHRVTWETAVSVAVAGAILLLLVNLRRTARMRVQISFLKYHPV